MTNLQEDWYPDPEGSPRNRYWDGERWTDRFSAPYEGAPNGLRAPEGTNPTTPWAWALAFAPIVTSAVSIAFTVGGARGSAGLASPAHPFAGDGPGYCINLLISLVLYLILALIAFRDARELRDREVPRPFGWGWSFLGPIVYMIGRSVIVRRRTGGGLAPLWVYLGAGVLSFIGSVSVSTAMAISVLNGS